MPPLKIGLDEVAGEQEQQDPRRAEGEPGGVDRPALAGLQLGAGTGVFTQEGILAVQPTSPSAVIMRSDMMKIEGTVYDPPLAYNVDCPLQLGQSGNSLSGKICDRNVETDL